MQRFATGTYLLWYPLLHRAEVEQLRRQLPGQGWKCLQAELQVSKASVGGMYGSGVFVINPPWTLAAELQQALPVLVKLLGQDDSAGFTLRCENM
jgi:23S rRNA (adenine2030-N6)-methyltransferase